MAPPWEDKTVNFDLGFSEIRLTSGEKIVDRIESVEDTKGNFGERGKMIVTDLRILWHSAANPRINISIGYDCITTISTKIVNSKYLSMPTTSLHLLTTSNGSRYEFVFNDLSVGNVRHFASVVGVHKAYSTSKTYRELKLRSAVLVPSTRQLRLLPLEGVRSVTPGIWNLSTDQGNLGTFYVTNVRLVWTADFNDSFNISLPYLQMESIRIRDSKFGRALVVECSSSSGGFVLGFRVDPEEKLPKLHKEIDSLFSVYSASPIYGVEYEWKEANEDERKQNESIVDDDVDDDATTTRKNDLMTYAMTCVDNSRDRPIIYSNEIGLAIESLPNGFGIQKLWEVVPT